ncbi:hypothetical protein OVA03_12725 [Asticcacaulis sp. SL142]|uniref:hypothetical protein n=1 Tax=Asticcacaulis sp. SL142 TaxID=2995155 RepID=UPI00226D117D|nr:hypothetical protein [Asticcacaulis sp. SL142]WAC47560.1 hypothetical protein OVA03_12725 [Asticcacaulis sp. SL142]
MNITTTPATPLRVHEAEWYIVEEYRYGKFTLHFTPEGVSLLSGWGEHCNPLNHPENLIIIGLMDMLNEGLWMAMQTISKPTYGSDVNSDYEEHGRRSPFEPDDEIPF